MQRTVNGGREREKAERELHESVRKAVSCLTLTILDA